MTVTWNPERYLSFADQRQRPAVDLLQRIPLGAPGIIADLGCGPGNSTGLLAERWPNAAIVGIDNSADMLAKARASGVRAEWVEADIGAWSPARPFDLIYANASLQWLKDHDELFPRLLACLAPQGVVAVQMPNNFRSPSHTLIGEVAERGPWAPKLADGWRWWSVREPSFYYALLAGQCTHLDLWESEYWHVLEGDDPVLNWTLGSSLLPLRERLDTDEFAAFQAAYGARLRAAYPKQPDGHTLFPFRRMFIVAGK